MIGGLGPTELFLIVACLLFLLVPIRAIMFLVKLFRRNETTPLGVADEIKKLSDLRDQGTLTDEEFNDQKKKLLSNKN